MSTQSSDAIKKEITNQLFLLESAFKSSLQDDNKDESTRNAYSIKEIFGGYSGEVLKNFIAYAFDTIVLFIKLSE